VKKLINDIIKLKSQEWKYSYNSQLQWLKSNVLSDDTHNIMLFNKQLIGYTLLRKRLLSFKYKKKLIKNFYYFDTFILHKRYRGKIFIDKKFSEIMMNYNNKIIIQKKYISILHCYKYMIKFYKKYGWKPCNSKKIYSFDKKRLNLMIYNFNSSFSSKIEFSIN